MRRPRIAANADALDCATPGGTPECMTTALKRSGWRSATSAAMLAPADKPQMATRARSTRYSAHTWSIAAMISATSPCALPDRVSNQFQQPCAFASRSCVG